MAMSDPGKLEGFSKWRHKQNGRVATLLTVAKGVGPDKGQDFAYFLGANSSGGMTAFVLRMEYWVAVMEKIEDAPHADEGSKPAPE